MPLIWIIILVNLHWSDLSLSLSLSLFFYIFEIAKYRGGKGPIITFKSNQKSFNYSRFSKSLNATSDTLPWYMGKSYNPSAEQGVLMAITWLILFNYIIPISLYVSLEVMCSNA